MSFNTALTAGQLTKLRSGSYASDYLVTFCANTVIFAGSVNSDLTTPQSWAQFAYNTVTVGAYTDVVVDQVLLIGTVNDITKATYRGRIRATPTNTIIYASESSQDFVAGAYFWVINSFDIINKLSRPDDNGNQLVDYDLPYAGLLPLVTGLRTAYCGWVDSGTGKYRVAFSIAAYACEYGATISSYLFSFKAASYTVIAGALNTAAVTVDFNPGEQWGRLDVTDNGGRTLTRHFYIKAHDASNLPDSGASNLTIADDFGQGWTMDYPAFTGVDSLLSNTFAVVWYDNETYGGIAGALDTTNNIAFVGWLQSEGDSALGDPTYAVLSEARLHFTGVSARLNRLVGQWLGFTINATPTEWGQINHLTPWRSIAHFITRYTTAGNLCDWDFSNKDDTYLFPAFSTQSSSALQAVQTIAAQINANVEFAPWGAVRVDRDAGYLTTAERAALTTVIAYNAQDLFSPAGGGGGITKTLESNRQVGKVDADGIVYNPTNGQYTPYTARGPGHAQGESVGSDTLSSQVLAATSDMIAALSELRQRVGNRYEIANMTETITVDHPDGYHYLIPSRAQVFTWTLDATLAGANGVNRIIYSTSIFWMLEAVSFGHTPDGVTNIKATYRRLTAVGDPGDNTTTIAPGEEQSTLPDIGLPAFPDEWPEIYIPDEGWPADEVPVTFENPPPGQYAWLDGREVIAWTGSQCFLLRNFITKTVPDASEVTPDDL